MNTQDLVEMYPKLKRESKNSSIATRTNLSKIAIFLLKFAYLFMKFCELFTEPGPLQLLIGITNPKNGAAHMRAPKNGHVQAKF